MSWRLVTNAVGDAVGGWLASPPRDDAAPFSLGPDKAKIGVLVVHGFTGTPAEMRPLGEALAARGFAVEGPLLAGHAGRTRDLAATRWPDWLASAEGAFDALRARAERVAVCGLSMGGLLALELARRRPDQVAALACLSTALWLSDGAIRLATVSQRVPLLRHAALPKISGSDIRDPEMRARNRHAQGRAGMSLAALASLVQLGAHVRAGLGQVRAPALLMHSRQDHTVPFACLAALGRELGSHDITQVALERSYHVITLDLEREEVFRAVAEHVIRHLGP